MMRVRRGASVVVAALLGVGSAVVIVAPPVPTQAEAGPGDGSLVVQVIRDVNGNGSHDPDFEVGVAGVAVTVTDKSGSTATETTDADGRVGVDLAGGQYRVEASIPDDMTYLQPAPAHGGLSSSVEFVDVSDGQNVTVTMGVWNVADYVGDDPRVAVPVQRNTVNGFHVNNRRPEYRSMVTFDYSAVGNQTSVQRIAQQRDTGTVMGIAYDRERERLFTAAFARRGTEYGPAGPGGIYVTDLATGMTSTWATVPDAGSTLHEESETTDDDGFFWITGMESLGDIALSEDNTELYVINLNNKTLYTYDATAGLVAQNLLTARPIPDPGCRLSIDDWRPGGLGVRDGVVYVGGVCSAHGTQDPADLRAVVYAYDPATGEFGDPVLNQKLDFLRGSLRRVTGVAGADTWYPWINDGFVWPEDQTRLASNAAPFLSDIAIEADGDLVLGFRDRFSDQVGEHRYATDDSTDHRYATVSGGDINRACRQPDGTFVWEGTGDCPNNNDRGVNSGYQDMRAGEFYPGDNVIIRSFLFQETAQGGVAIDYSAEYLLTSGLNPWRLETGGIYHLHRHSGFRHPLDGGYQASGLEILQQPLTHYDGEQWAESQGLGNLAILAEPAPVQLGNRVWWDVDDDGLQGAGEPGIPGVTVRLMECGSILDTPEVLAGTVTDDAGEYSFDGVSADACYDVQFDPSTADTSGLPGQPNPAGLRFTAQRAGNNSAVDSDADAGGLATRNETGGPGSVDHSIDAGLIYSAIGDCVWSDVNGNGVQDPGEAPVPGVTLRLHDASGNPVTEVVDLDSAEPATAVTDDTDCAATLEGNYRFDDVPDGTYQVCVTLPEGTEFTEQNTGEDDRVDSDMDVESGCAEPVTVSPGSRVDLTIDAGVTEVTEVTGLIGDCVWSDTDGNGVQDSGEPAVPDTTVILYDADGNEIDSTDTDDTDCAATGTEGMGNYQFATLALDRSYQACVDLDTLPDGTELSARQAGSGPATDSDGDPDTGCSELVALSAERPHDRTIDFGVHDRSDPPSKSLAVTGIAAAGLIGLAAGLLVTGWLLVTMARRGSRMRQTRSE